MRVEETHEALRKCPFCGGAAKVKPYGENHYTIGCSHCGITQMYIWSSLKEAVNAWNTRVNDVLGQEWNL